MMPPAHLLHVFPSFNVGGAQVRFAALSEALGDRFSHTVLSLNGNYDGASLLAPSVKVTFADPAPRAANMPGRLRQYRARIAATTPDILLTYNWGAIEPALANMVGGAPHIHMEDGFGPEEAQRQFPRRVWMRRIALSRSQVVVPSLTLQTLAEGNWRLNRRRVHYIPNGLSARSSYSTALESLSPDLPAGLPRIVWTGALRPEKNPIRLVRAFAQVRDQAVLVVIGDGPERAAVSAEANRLGLGDRIRMLGHRSDARDLIMQCDILALSSDTEQMPFAVLEAMDAGLAVASADVGDVKRMVAPSNQPFVVAPTQDALAGAFKALLADAPLRARIGQDNQARLRDQYSLTTMVDRYGALFDRTMAQGRQGLANDL